MFTRNVGTKERVARIVGGILMMLCGIIGLKASVLGLMLTTVGAISIVTGIVRFCPACALAGRKSGG
jgi:hypothetical protein